MVLLVFAGVDWLDRDGLGIDHDKFFGLLLARTGGNNGGKAEHCQKYDVLRHL